MERSQITLPGEGQSKNIEENAHSLSRHFPVQVPKDLLNPSLIIHKPVPKQIQTLPLFFVMLMDEINKYSNG